MSTPGRRAADVVAHFAARGRTVATAESLTAGLLAGALYSGARWDLVVVLGAWGAVVVIVPPGSGSAAGRPRDRA